MFAGRFASSRSHLEAALTLYDPISHRSLVHHAATHPDVHSQAELAIVLFCLGYPDQALARSNVAIAEARRLAHPPSMALSLALGSLLLSLVGDHAAVDERADQLDCGDDRAGFPLLGCNGNDLSRLGKGQEWRCGGGYIAPAQRFDRLPRHRGRGVDAISYRPLGQGM